MTNGTERDYTRVLDDIRKNTGNIHDMALNHVRLEQIVNDFIKQDSESHLRIEKLLEEMVSQEAFKHLSTSVTQFKRIAIAIFITLVINVVWEIIKR